MYSVIFRACDRVNAVNGVGRPWGIHKTSLIKACFSSLVKSLAAFPHKITVLGDKLSDDLIGYFRSQNVELILGSFGNDESIRQTLKLALTAPNEDWIYFCEDDYLHHPDTFRVVDELILNKDRYLAKSPLNPMEYLQPGSAEHLVIFPSDYPDRYQPRQRHPSRIYVSGECHWRQIRNVTFTFLAKSATVKKYSKAIEHCSNGANDGRLSRMLFSGVFPGASAMCLSPIPGLTAHMHEGVMSPLVDWKSLMPNPDIDVPSLETASPP